MSLSASWRDQRSSIDVNSSSDILSRDKAVYDICKANGISKERFIYNRDSIQDIQIFMHHSFKRISGLNHFIALKKLRLINQGLERIEGLDALANLECLWLNENKFQTIQGLEKLTKLRELYLYGNQIRKIEGLSTLANLEKLWIFDNRITEITGLDNLVQLKVLSIAANLIENINPDSFRNNINLTELNLAANQIGRFKEIQLLNQITSLENLSLKCVNFGENPVCSLCNYQTYALYHLPNIKKLDSLIVTEEARNIADATFLKKKMYYNMRIKTLKRNAINVTSCARSIFTTRNNECNLSLNVLVRSQRELERELVEESHQETISDDQLVSPYQKRKKLEIILKEVSTRHSVIEELQNKFELFQRKVNSTIEENISRLLIELETGGNIRFEEGRAEDVWYHSCVDLIKSRFFPNDFSPLGLSELNVIRVTRIHNRYLRNRFERKLDEIVDTSDPSYKRSLEYLFYGEGLAGDIDLFNVIEDGFPSAETYSQFGLDPAIALSNSVSICEIPRLLLKQKTNPEWLNNGPIQGKLLIAKVYLGSFKAERNQSTSEEQYCSVSQDSYPYIDSVYKTKDTDPKQRKWFIFDHKLVLPEYLVEYELIPSTLMKSEADRSEKIHNDYFSSLKLTSETDILDTKAHASHYAEFYQFCSSKNLKAKDLSHTIASTLNAVAAHKKISIMSKYTISQVTNSSDFKSIVYLNLFGNTIRRIESLEELVHLKELILSFNEIEKIEGLNHCKLLEKLYLDFNLIKKIEGLQHLRNLKVLYLNNNLVYRVEDVLALNSKTLTDLREFSLCNNPICEVPSYRHILIRRLNHLEILDNRIVTDAERIFSNTELHVVTDELIKSCLNKPGSRCLSYFQDIRPTSNLIKTAENWYESVQDLDLSRKRLRRIIGLEKLSNLKRLSLNNNEIGRIENLNENIHLRELSIEENRISKIEGLSNLSNLRKLELGSNNITKIENLDMCLKLTQLSLECNQITTLSGVEKLANIMELYLANNKIRTLQEVLHLKTLSKLIILDLSGNPMCSDRQYRLYIVFNLKKLKVLDGIGVGPGEVQLSREEFSGKITTDVLKEVLGENDDYGSVLSLNLNGSSIKHLTNTAGPLFDKFTRLQELILKNNVICTLNGLQNVSDTLRVLHLDNNKLGETCNSNPVGATIGRYFERFMQLEVLTLDDNCLTNMACLHLGKLRNLRVLSLNRNEIAKIEGLQGCVCLQELYLNKNRIRSLDQPSGSGVSELTYLTRLTCLQIEENGLRSLDGVQHLNSLLTLNCTSNRIVDLGELEKIVELSRTSNLQDVSLASNPVTRKSAYRSTLIFYCPSIIKLDGKEITDDERQKANTYFGRESDNTSYPANIFTSQPATNTTEQLRQIGFSKAPVRVAAVQFEYGHSEATSGASPENYYQQSSGGMSITGPSCKANRDSDRYLPRASSAKRHTFRTNSGNSVLNTVSATSNVMRGYARNTNAGQNKAFGRPYAKTLQPTSYHFSSIGTVSQTQLPSNATPKVQNLFPRVL